MRTGIESDDSRLNNSLTLSHFHRIESKFCPEAERSVVKNLHLLPAPRIYDFAIVANQGSHSGSKGWSDSIAVHTVTVVDMIGCSAVK